MATGIVNFLENMLAPTTSTTSINPTRNIDVEPMNPSANPFVTVKGSNPFANYAKNRPVTGGYFAGYYNNKPNIVGQRLFVEV